MASAKAHNQIPHQPYNNPYEDLNQNPYQYNPQNFYGTTPQYENTSKVAAPSASTSEQMERERGAEEVGFRDLWAAIFFILQFLAMHAILIYLGVKGLQQSGQREGDSVSVSESESGSGSALSLKNILPQLMGAAGMGIVFSFVWLQLIMLAPMMMIHVSLWWGVAMAAACSVFFFTISNIYMGIIFIVIALINIVFAVLARPRIPFAAAMLRQAVVVIRQFPSTVGVALLWLFVSLEFIALWIFGASGAAGMASNALITVGLLFSLYWTMEVFRNISHVTTCGVVATYYFQRQSLPPNPTGKSLKRAVTTSFGSICFGSLIVAIIQTVRAIVSSIAQRRTGHPVALILAACAELVLGWIESLLRYFNKWAYVQVAVYGKSFVDAAKSTWDLFKNQGFDMVINDDLVISVLFMGCVINGLTAATVAGLWTHFVGRDDMETLFVVIIAFFIVFTMTNLTLSVVESAVTTYYVCYAEDPSTLQRTDPDFCQTVRARHTLLMQ